MAWSYGGVKAEGSTTWTRTRTDNRRAQGDNAGMTTIVVFGDEPPALNPVRLPPSRHLMHIENALLLAPQCVKCECFHLREGFYEVDGRMIRNLRLAAPTYDLPRGELFSPSHCAAGIRDWCIGWSPRGQGI